jgi:hypothetical protein
VFAAADLLLRTARRTVSKSGPVIRSATATDRPAAAGFPPPTCELLSMQRGRVHELAFDVRDLGHGQCVFWVHRDSLG